LAQAIFAEGCPLLRGRPGTGHLAMGLAPARHA